MVLGYNHKLNWWFILCCTIMLKIFVWSMLYGSITISPHKCIKTCWLAESRHERQRIIDADNQQISVHMRGPGVLVVVLYNDYHQKLQKRILIDRILYIRRRCQSTEPLGQLFGDCTRGTTTCSDYNIPMIDSNDIKHSKCRAFSSSSSFVWNKDEHSHQNLENASS